MYDAYNYINNTRNIVYLCLSNGSYARNILHLHENYSYLRQTELFTLFTKCIFIIYCTFR